MENKKLLGEKDLMQYLSIGRNAARTVGRNAGAVVHIGKRILYRREAIDQFVDGNDRLADRVRHD